MPAVPWRPYLANPDLGLSADPYPRCPAPQATGIDFMLDDAPLPRGFDPFRQDGTPVLACMLVDRTGEILKVKVSGGGSHDAMLEAAILKRWRLDPIEGDRPPLSWQRARLDAGPAEAYLAVPFLRM